MHRCKFVAVALAALTLVLLMCVKLVIVPVVSEGSTITTTTTTRRKQKDDLLLDNYNFCNASHLGGDPLWYRCDGKNYNAFADKLHDFLEHHNMTQNKPRMTWGRRTMPIPANTTLLFFGNSHTRQQGLALVCQMGAAQIQDVHHYTGMHDTVDPDMVKRYRFHNGAVVYLVINSYAAYSNQWQTLLEQQIGQPLADMDVMVMGIFNDPRVGGTAFSKRMQYFAKTLPPDHGRLDLTQYPPGPSPLNVMQVFNGTLLLLSNLGTQQQGVFDDHCQWMVQRAQETNRQNCACLRGRKYITAMHAEGAALGKSKVDIQDALDNGKRGATLHRCIGARGGHPDLLAWDMAEFLQQIS